MIKGDRETRKLTSSYYLRMHLLICVIMIDRMREEYVIIFPMDIFFQNDVIQTRIERLIQ